MCKLRHCSNTLTVINEICSSIVEDWLHYYEESSAGTLSSISGFPKKIQDVFNSASYPVAMASIFHTTGNNGEVCMVKDKELIKYSFKTKATGIQANYVDKWDLDKGEYNPLNADSRDPTEVPYPLSGLYINKEENKGIGFEGKKMYINEWGTGSWAYQGKVKCPVAI